MSMNVIKRCPCTGRSQRQFWFRRADGSQLLEFALALPLLLLLLVGICDFAVSINTKHILNNASREGARIGAAQPIFDPASPGVIRDAVIDYLSGAGVDTSFISASPAAAGNFTWTYYSSGTNGLKIERNVLVVTSGGANMTTTRVTLTYPYNWTFGFNNVVRLAVPSANYGSSITISTDALIANIN
jgi:Flp pilus assembly protein TadG